MNLKDIIISPLVRDLLMENGRSDAERGVSMYEGWQEVAELCEYDPHQRTTAREAYEDGYYSFRRKPE